MNIKRNIDWSRDADRLSEVNRVSELPLTNSDKLLLTDYLLKEHEDDGNFWTFHDLPPLDTQRYADVQDFSLMESYFAKAPTRVSQTSKLHRSEVMERLFGPRKGAKSWAKRTNKSAPWFDLWTKIDRTEYLIQRNADLKGERKSPIRPKLYERLDFGLLEGEESAQLIANLDAQARQLDEMTLKKLKLDLVRLRRQQYDLLDGLKGEQVKLINKGKPQAYFESDLNLAVYPAATEGSQHFPFRFTSDAEIERLQKRARKLLTMDKTATLIDLTDPEVLRVLITNYRDLKGHAHNNTFMESLVHYIDLYADECKFNIAPLLVYEGRKENLDPDIIQANIEQAMGKKYALNYLYTIFTNQVLGPIAAKALEHLEILRAVARGPQEFKQCSRCNEYKVRSVNNFPSRSSAKDGFLGVCKECKAKDRAKKAKEKANKTARR